MAHSHSVYDTDTHFTINPVTRAIKNDSSKKTILMQRDHNSERFTFELPRYIEGHDMSLCNQVEVHYLNIASKTEQNSGLYTVDDFQISPEDENTVVCSWLISKNATQLKGKLTFLLNFRCLEEGFEKYSWHTDVYNGINVSEGIDAAFEHETEYVDVIEQWKADVMATFTTDLSQWKATTKGELETDIDNKFNEHSTEWNTALAVERARIDQFKALKEGSTTGDAELQDIRVDYMGNNHTSAGDAVRAGLTVQNDTLKSVLNTVHLPVAYNEIAGLGFATNKEGKAILMANENAVLQYGIIEKTGYYNLFAPALIAKNELNETEYLPYSSYDATDRENVFIEAGSYFYTFGVGLVPQHCVSYLPESIVVAISPDEKELTITANEEISHTEIEGLLEDEFLRINTGRYGLYCFPVQKGVHYRLQSAYFDFPSNGYQLIGFANTTKFEKNVPYIKGGVYTNEGVIDIVFKSPIDGYLLVSNDTNTPANFILKKVAAMSKVSNIDRSVIQPYQKLLTIGDSLSGNLKLWQPTAIELLNIPEYGILGGAGLTVANQGDDVNTIYNRVMTMELDNSVDIITFWGGYNDFSAGVILSSLEEQLDPTTRDSTTFYGGVLDCVEKILSTYPLKQVVMIGTTPFYVNGSWQTKKNPRGLKIEDYVNAFRTVAEYFSIPFLDLLHTSGFNSYNYSKYYLDQTYWLHPNSEGNKIVGTKIAGFIKGLNGTY